MIFKVSVLFEKKCHIFGSSVEIRYGQFLICAHAKCKVNFFTSLSFVNFFFPFPPSTCLFIFLTPIFQKKSQNPKKFYFINKYSVSSFFILSKGQLISKCPFGIFVWTKLPTKLFLDFCHEFFCSFLGASLGLSM